MRVIAAMLFGALAACYSPRYTSCTIACTQEHVCPSGMSCVAGSCVGPGMSCSSDAGDDAPADMSTVDSAFGPWNAPVQLDFGLGPTVSVDDPAPRGDMLEMLININDADIYRTLRATVDDPWGTATLVAELDSTSNLGGQDLSEDGLTVMWSDDATGNRELWLATRSAAIPTSAFGTHRSQTQLNSGSAEGTPSLSPGELTVAFYSGRTGVEDLYVATRPSLGADFNPPFALTTINDVNAREDSPCFSHDLLTIYFSSSRNTANRRDLFFATRSDAFSDFDHVQPITELNTTDLEADPWVSPDGHTMYFTRTPAAGGPASIWYTTR